MRGHFDVTKFKAELAEYLAALGYTLMYVRPLHEMAVHIPGSSEDVCTNFQSWKDADGKACQDYAHRCGDGKVNEPVQKQTMMIEQKKNANGTSAVDACCMCGGGIVTTVW